jgi:hypothetical protein
MVENRPVRRRVFGPELVIDGRRRPYPMKEMINPRFFFLGIFLQFGIIAFNAF